MTLLQNVLTPPPMKFRYLPVRACIQHSLLSLLSWTGVIHLMGSDGDSLCRDELTQAKCCRAGQGRAGQKEAGGRGVITPLFPAFSASHCFPSSPPPAALVGTLPSSLGCESEVLGSNPSSAHIRKAAAKSRTVTLYPFLAVNHG